MTGTRTILLTGASGVVGRAVLARLSPNPANRVICLVHRHTPPGAAETVVADLRRADLGLAPAARRRLVERVDAVVHCAAVTDFSADPDEVQRINVSGTRAVVDFAAEAEAVLHHVSSAFVARNEDASAAAEEAAADPSPYLTSKREAERVVRQAATAFTILRPSVVIGDSGTGEMARFQGLHSLAAAILRGALPLVPLCADDRIDLMPQDRVAAAIEALIEHDIRDGTYWITAGEEAPTAQTLVNLTVDIGRRAGLDIHRPRLIAPSMVDRLVRPVFVEPLPAPARRRFDDLVALSALCAQAGTFPTSLGRIPGCAPPTGGELATAYRRSIRYLATRKGLVAAAEAA